MTDKVRPKTKSELRNGFKKDFLSGETAEGGIVGVSIFRNAEGKLCYAPFLKKLSPIIDEDEEMSAIGVGLLNVLNQVVNEIVSTHNEKVVKNMEQRH